MYPNDKPFHVDEDGAITGNDYFNFIIDLETDKETVLIDIKSPDKHTSEVVHKLLGKQEKMREFLECINGRHISVWSEVLPKEMMDELKEKGIHHGISIIKPSVSASTSIMCLALTKSDDQPVTKCLDIYAKRMDKATSVLKDLIDKKSSTNH